MKKPKGQAKTTRVSPTRREFLRRTRNTVATSLLGASTLLDGCQRAREPCGQDSRAARIHRESIVIAIHDHNPIAPDVGRMLAGGVTGKVFQIGVDVIPGPDIGASASLREGWYAKSLESVKAVHRAIAADSGRLMLAVTAEDFVRAKREGKVAILIGVEGAKLLEGRIEELQGFYQLGLRELQLRWAVPNQVVETETLTPFGVKLVSECNRLGIIVCVTHIPNRAFYEVMELTTKPPIVSHGAAAGSPQGIDLEDAKLRALAERRGVLGIHFYSTYLGENPVVSRVVDQVDYISDVAGIDTVALGVDLFPTTGPWREFQLAQGTRDISWAISDLGEMPRVTEELVGRGYSDEDIRKVLGGNFLRVCREVFGR